MAWRTRIYVPILVEFEDQRIEIAIVDVHTLRQPAKPHRIALAVDTPARRDPRDIHAADVRTKVPGRLTIKSRLDPNVVGESAVQQRDIAQCDRTERHKNAALQPTGTRVDGIGGP